MLTTMIYRVWKVHNSDVFRNEIRGVCVFTQTNIIQTLSKNYCIRKFAIILGGGGRHKIVILSTFVGH